MAFVDKRVSPLSSRHRCIPSQALASRSSCSRGINMGGCASRPKEPSDAIPSENPAETEVFAKPIEGEVPSEGKDHIVEETKEEKPLVDLSEPVGEISAAALTEELARGISEQKSEKVTGSSVGKEDKVKDVVEEIKVTEAKATEKKDDPVRVDVEHPLQ